MTIHQTTLSTEERKKHYTAPTLPFCFLDTGEPSPPSAVVASSEAVSPPLPFAARVRFPIVRVAFAEVEGPGSGSPVVGNVGTGSKLNGIGLLLRVVSDEELAKSQRGKAKTGRWMYYLGWSATACVSPLLLLYNTISKETDLRDIKKLTLSQPQTWTSWWQTLGVIRIHRLHVQA